ncbi:hypothetical protein I350_02884 [Cryptococcus amylolentus CBS 6273]|uniref:Restriction of telomere capping protein 4 n=1 Tax=Cryptococcus amylolentus CBS 6273 TaxID=1296118 RepID=A0A1E3K7W7_9TREE|nr:hypothetical protein I350_02884 [Cryptococcus amylolentus CBS 6273]
MEGAEVNHGNIFDIRSSPDGTRDREEYARQQRARIDQRHAAPALHGKSSARAVPTPSMFVPKKKRNALSSGSQGSSQETSAAIAAKRRLDRDAVQDDSPRASPSALQTSSRARAPPKDFVKELLDDSSPLNKPFATSASQRSNTTSPGLESSEMQRRDREIERAEERKRRNAGIEREEKRRKDKMGEKEKNAPSNKKSAADDVFASIFATRDKLHAFEAGQPSLSSSNPTERQKAKGRASPVVIPDKPKSKGKGKGREEYDCIALISPARTRHAKRSTAKQAPSSEYDTVNEDDDNSDDELALGNTPPSHKHDIYRSSRAPPSSLPRPSSQRSLASAHSEQVLIPDSDEESSPGQSSGASRVRKRGSSERVAAPGYSDDDDDYYRDNSKKKKKKRMMDNGTGKLARQGVREEREKSLESVPLEPLSRATSKNPFAATSRTRSTALPPDKNAPKPKPKPKPKPRPSPPRQRQMFSQKSTGGKITIVSDDDASSEEELDEASKELLRKQMQIKAQQRANDRQLRAHDGAKKGEARKKEQQQKKAAGNAKKVVDENDKGHSFFKMLENMDVHDDLEEFDDDFLDGPSFNLDTTMEEEDDDDWLDGDYTDAQREWILRHVNKKNPCPYCDEPLPFNPTEHIENLKARLDKLSKPAPTTRNPNARDLHWQQAIEFCTLHRAEATIIPLGIQAGYPETIDFKNLDRRLEEGWVWAEIEKIVKDPSRSEMFLEVKREIESVGKMRWGGIMHQSKAERLLAVKPGYYGELGRVIMTDHFQKLQQWNYLSPCVPPARPGSDITDDLILPISPLSAADFIANVLVPEASIFLIMDDNQCRSFDRDAYDDAARTREESAQYGNTKFREGDRQAKKLLEELRKGAPKKRERVKRLLGKKKVKSTNKEDDENKENRRPASSGAPAENGESLIEKASQQSSDMWEGEIDNDTLLGLGY